MTETETVPDEVPAAPPVLEQLPPATAAGGSLFADAAGLQARAASELLQEVREALKQLRGAHLYSHEPWRTPDNGAQAMVLVRLPQIITSQLGMVMLQRVFSRMDALCDRVEAAEARASKAELRAGYACADEQAQRQWKEAADREVNKQYERASRLEAELAQAREELLAREHLLGDIRHAEYQVQVLGERVDRQAEELRRARIDAALIYADRVAADPLCVGATGQEAQELAARACYRAGTYYTRSEAQRAMARVAGLPVPGAPRRGRGGRRG